MRRMPTVDAFLEELEGESDIDVKVAPLVKRYLAVARAQLLEIHRETGSGRQAARGWAQFGASSFRLCGRVVHLPCRSNQRLPA